MKAKFYNLSRVPTKTPVIDLKKWNKEAKENHKQIIEFYKSKPGYFVSVINKENRYV